MSTLPNPFVFSNSLPDGNALDGLERETSEQEGQQRPNFPFLFPIVYHNINLEIRPKHAFVARLSFNAARSVSWCLLFSVFASFFSSNFESVNSLTGMKVWKEIILSIVNFIIGTALIFYVQYFPIYTSLKNEIPNKTSIPVQCFTIFILLIYLAGIPGTGTVGVLYVIASFQQGDIANKVISIILTIWHLINIIVEFVALLFLQPLFGTQNIMLDSEMFLS